MTRLWRYISVLLLLGGMLGPFTSKSASAADADYAVTNGWFYSQAAGDGGAAGKGFAITDDGGIPFYKTFRDYGGVAALGYPASQRFELGGFPVQATQRVILQYQPGKGMFFLNVFDLLSDRGMDTWLENVRQTP